MRIRSLPVSAAPADADGAIHPHLRLAAALTLMMLSGIALFLAAQLFGAGWNTGIAQVLDVLDSPSFWTAVAVGLLAQAIDGALGMAYGITATSFLLGSGVPPAVATASVHMAEVFTTGFSGLAHLRFGNVQRRLFLKLLLPGILGTVAGALVVTQVDAAILKPLINAYLLLMGLHILRKAWRRRPAADARPVRRVAPLALFGGFADAAGGGGWGPIVTSTLVGSGHEPRQTIGSVNFAEFFLTLTAAATFAVLVGAAVWPVIAGLVVGGLFAAPFAALITRRLAPRLLLLIVGAVITLLSLLTLLRALSS